MLYMVIQNREVAAKFNKLTIESHCMAPHFSTKKAIPSFHFSPSGPSSYHRLRYIDVQLGVFLVLREWLGYVTCTLISGKYTCEIL